MNEPDSLNLEYALKFPRALWDIISNCKTGAISWGHFGSSIKINKHLFEKEYPNWSGNFSSFIRQLNAYGFRKLKNQIKYTKMPAEFTNDVVEYQHPLFVKGHPEFLPCVRRKPDKKRKRVLSKENATKEIVEEIRDVNFDITEAQNIVQDQASFQLQNDVLQELQDQCFLFSI